jgi:hypothetical protein
MNRHFVSLMIASAGVALNVFEHIFICAQLVKETIQ